MSYKSDTRNIKYVLAHLESRLQDLENTSSQLQGLIESETDIENIRTASQLLLNQVIEFNMYWTSYTNTYKDAIEEDVEKERIKREQAEQDTERYKAALSQALKQLKIYQSQAIDLALVNRANQLFDLVEENVKSLAVSVKLKTEDKRGKAGIESNRYNRSVNNTDLTNDYISSGYVITDDMVKKYKMTKPGLRSRLISLGVYKKRQPK